MKVHNDLKELLDAFSVEIWGKGNPELEIIYNIIDDFLASNSLASSEPKPLAKNKQMHKICTSCDGRGSTVVFTECFMCKKCDGSGTVQIADATSR